MGASVELMLRLAPGAVSRRRFFPVGAVMGDDRPDYPLDAKLRQRLDAAFSDMMTALDAAMEEPTASALEELREATDRLMRAGARVRLAVESAAQIHEVPPR
jgi:hypothetical protein